MDSNFCFVAIGNVLCRMVLLHTLLPLKMRHFVDIVAEISTTGSILTFCFNKIILSVNILLLF